MLKKLFGLVSLFILAVLPACSKKIEQPYQPPKLNHLECHTADFSHTQDGISVNAKKLSPSMLPAPINYRSHKNSLVPIQLTFHNNSESTVSLSPKDINLSTQNAKTVFRRIKSGTGKSLIGGLVGLGLAGALFAGGAFFVFTPFHFIGLGVCGVSAALGLSSLTTSGVYEFKTHAKNSIIHAYVQRNGLFKEHVIHPNSTFNKLIFVRKKDFESEFTLQLKNQNEQHTFFIDLNQQS